LYLLQLASRRVAKPSTGPSQIVRCQLRHSDASGGFLYDVPNCFCCHPISPCPSYFVDPAKQLSSINCGRGEPIVPSWPVPVFTPSSGLVQLFRSDFVRQITPAETTTRNYGNTKGMDIIPWYKTELDIAAPPYIQHNSTAKDGLGDRSMLLKYRVISANEKNGAYSVSVSLTGTIPTGSYKNGSTDASIAPAMYAGKGFGKFDVQSSLSATLPTGDTAKLGRPVVWNVVVQYKIGKIFWPEIENNATFCHGGSKRWKSARLRDPRG
jgi:hypothetical protein